MQPCILRGCVPISGTNPSKVPRGTCRDVQKVFQTHLKVSRIHLGLSIAIGRNSKLHGMQNANGPNSQQSNHRINQLAHEIIDMLVNHDMWSAVALYSSKSYFITMLIYVILPIRWSTPSQATHLSPRAPVLILFQLKVVFRCMLLLCLAMRTNFLGPVVPVL